MALPALAAILPMVMQGAQSMMQSGQGGGDAASAGGSVGKTETKAPTGALNVGGQKAAGSMPGMLGEIVKTPNSENQKGFETLANVFNSRTQVMSDEGNKTNVEASGLDRVRAGLRELRGY